nr:unnamed protein product [Haemonchus contortus]
MESDFFPPFLKNKSFPQLCDGVSVEFDSKRGRHIVATRDIPCGEAVCLDTGKVVNLEDGLCRYCLNELPENHFNQICNECVDQEKFYGPFEQPFMDELKDLGMFRLAVHLALSYPSEEILSYCESGEFQRVKTFDNVPVRSDSLTAALSLQTDAYPVDLSSTDDLVKRIVSKLDEHPHWSLLPKDCRLDYFATLLRLISSRLMTNAHSIYFVDRLESRLGDASSDGFTPSGVGLFPVASWFNHSCRANLNSFFYGDKLIFVSAGVRKGEEICDNYGVSFFNYTTEERKKFLAGRGFTCHCSVCVTNDSIDNLLESSIDYPKVLPESLSTVEDFKQLTNSLPDGHKNIETIAQTYAKAAGSTDPKLQLFLYEQILECQRRRGLHFSPEQIRTHLSCALSSYDVMRKSLREKQVYGLNIQIHLFAALVRMRTFYGKLYPAYNAAKSAADEFTRMQETGLEADFAVTMEGLRSAVYCS